MQQNTIVLFSRISRATDYVRLFTRELLKQQQQQQQNLTLRFHVMLFQNKFQIMFYLHISSLLKFLRHMARVLLALASPGEKMPCLNIINAFWFVDLTSSWRRTRSIWWKWRKSEGGFSWELENGQGEVPVLHYELSLGAGSPDFPVRFLSLANGFSRAEEEAMGFDRRRW